MKRKILALALTVLMFVGAVPLAAMAEISAPVAAEPAEEPAVVTKLAASPAVCDLCGKTVDATEKLACGEHSACADCAKNEYYMLKHNEKLPCGKYECDGGDHYRLPNDYCPDTENPHYHCEDPDATHTCPTCGVTYNCALSANQHAKCAECGRAWCKGQHGFCTVCGEWRCTSGGSHNPCSAKGCGLYDCQTHYHCAGCGAVEFQEGSHPTCGVCGGYLCDGKSHSHEEKPDPDGTTGSDSVDPPVAMSLRPMNIVEEQTEEPTKTEESAKTEEPIKTEETASAPSTVGGTES